MSYNYHSERANLFTEQGQYTFLKIRDNVNRLIEDAGAVTMMSAIHAATGDVWFLMACVDRLVELGEIREVEQGPVAGQFRIFTK